MVPSTVPAHSESVHKSTHFISVRWGSLVTAVSSVKYSWRKTPGKPYNSNINTHMKISANINLESDVWDYVARLSFLPVLLIVQSKIVNQVHQGVRNLCVFVVHLRTRFTERLICHWNWHCALKNKQMHTDSSSDSRAIPTTPVN